MKLIELTNGKFAKVDDEDYDYLMQWKWYGYFKAKERWYACALEHKHIAKANNRRWRRCIYMARIIMKVSKTKEVVDHRNHDTLDNRKSNLRICTTQQNRMNGLKSKRKFTSKYKGVHFNLRKKWRAGIKFNGETINLGSYTNEKDAAMAYNLGAQMYFGEFAHLNKL